MALPSDLNPADLVALGALLAPEGGPARSFSIDPAKVTLPGIWCRIDGLAFAQLRGLAIKTTLHLVIADTDWDRALTNLAPLLNHVRGVIDADPDLGDIGPGDVRLVGVPLPGSTTPLPALAVPYTLHTTQE